MPDERAAKTLSLLAVGGAHVDRRGQVAGLFVPGASNPGVMKEEVGGGVFNALRNASARGIRASLLSLRGGDATGAVVAKAVVEAGIADLSATFLDRQTASYTALLDREGELIAGLADMTLYDTVFAKQLSRRTSREAVEAADAVLCDANMPPDALAALAAMTGGKPLYAIAISPVKSLRLAGVLPQLACLFMNIREAAGLSGLRVADGAPKIIAALRGQGLAAAVITAGREPVLAYDSAGIFSLTPPQPRRIVDVTGAGDALAGMSIAAMMRGADLRAALREGMAAAIRAVESPLAVPDFDLADFDKTLDRVPAIELIG
jgi:pseudouridine kinase